MNEDLQLPSALDGDGTVPFDLTLAMKVAYDGAPFCGFAKQPGKPTVQGEVEHALQLLFKREVETTCAGRTDSGVHAIGQVISFHILREELRGRSMRTLLRSMNALTADRIIVKGIREMPLGFSARFDAKARVYKYFLAVAPYEPLYMFDYSWHTGPLDVDAMDEASRALIGEHDFKSFCVAQSAIGRTTNRCVDRISFDRTDVLEDELVVVTIEGNAFLHSMVRTITGSLVAVGKGKRKPSWMASVLAATDRKAAGETAPAKGLTLWDVIY